MHGTNQPFKRDTCAVSRLYTQTQTPLLTCANILAEKLLRLTLMPSGSLCLSSKRVRPSVATFWQMMLMAGSLLSSSSLRMLSCKQTDATCTHQMLLTIA